MHFAHLANTPLGDDESARDNHAIILLAGKWIRFDKIMVVTLWPHFLAHPVQ